MTLKEKFSLKLLAWVSWLLPEEHPALPLLYEAAYSIGAVAKNRELMPEKKLLEPPK